MATLKTTDPQSTDQGFVILLVPFGATKPSRIIVPHEVACWLRDELCAAVGKPAKASRQNKDR